MTRVHIVAGYLGAGKTTVLRQILPELVGTTSTAVIVNDFGTASLDAEALQGASQVEIRGECICCTAPDGFVSAVASLVDDGIERIVVEPTGLAQPADLVDTLRRGPIAERVVVAPVVVVADTTAVAAAHPATMLGLAAADRVVLNRIDLASPQQRMQAEERVALLWPPPQLRAVSHGAVSAAFVLGDGEAGSRSPSHGHSHPPVQTLQFSAEEVFSRDALTKALGELTAERLKGIFRTDEGTWLMELAGGHLHQEPTARRSPSRVDAFGATEGLQALLRACLTTGGIDATRIELVHRERRMVGRTELASLPPHDVATHWPKYAGTAAELAALFPEATPQAQVVVVASDGFAAGPVAYSELQGALLLHSLEDGPLPAGKGGPYRLLVPGAANPCSNVKGVVRIRISEPESPQPGFA